MNKLVYIFIIVMVLLGYATLSYYYYKDVLDIRYFAIATVTVLLAFFTMLILSRHKQIEQKYTGFRIYLNKFMYLMLPYLVFASLIIELHLYGRLGLVSITAITVIFTILVISRERLDAVLVGVVTLLTIISFLYGIYTPTFGNDTWRDAIQAMQIAERGGLKGLTITHIGYPFPLVSLLYAAYSIVTSVNTVWSSNVIGILYLLLLILWVHVLSKKLNTGYHRIASLLALTTPLIIVWSVWFTHQAYALLMTLPLLFLKLPLSIVVVLIIALALGHGGVALWTLGIFFILIISIKTFNVKASTHIVLHQLNTKSMLFFIVFIIYASYTILMVLKEATMSVFEAIMAFLSGEKVITVATPIQAPITSILGIMPIAILTVLGLIRMLEDNDIIMRLLAFISLAGLAIAYISTSVFPALDLLRYLGLGSVTLLAILSPQAFQSLIRRGKVGTGYAYALLLLAILSFGFAGTLMPGNPYTENPYTGWSISGLITYGEAQELDDIAFKLCCNNYLLDWRSGTYIGYKYLWIHPLSKGFYNPEAQGFFTYAGNYGFLVTPEYLTSFNGVLIFRRSSLNMLEAYSPGIDVFLNNMIDKVSILYMSPQIRIISFK